MESIPYKIPNRRLIADPQYGELKLRMPDKCEPKYLIQLPDNSMEGERLLAIRQWFEEECQYKSWNGRNGRNALVLLGTQDSRMLEFCHSMIEDFTPEKVVHINKFIFPKRIFKHQKSAQLTIVDGFKYEKQKEGVPIWFKYVGGGGACPLRVSKYEGAIPAIVLCYMEDKKSRDLYYAMKEHVLYEDYCYYVDVSDLTLV